MEDEEDPEEKLPPAPLLTMHLIAFTLPSSHLFVIPLGRRTNCCSFDTTINTTRMVTIQEEELLYRKATEEEEVISSVPLITTPTAINLLQQQDCCFTS